MYFRTNFTALDSEVAIVKFHLCRSLGFPCLCRNPESLDSPKAIPSDKLVNQFNFLKSICAVINN